MRGTGIDARAERTQPTRAVSRDSLSRTRLLVPQTRPGTVSRSHLGGIVCELRPPVVTVTAPAGYGKTTALIDWQRLSRSAQPLAWLSLDQNDNDPLLFWQHIIRALRTIHLDISDQIPQLFNAPQPPPLEVLLLALVQAIAKAPQHFVLVLDDYHVITTPAIHESLDYLLAHFPPQMHIVISSRQNPPLALARLRVKRQLREVRASDLRFTCEEAGILFNQVMELKLPEETIAARLASV